MKTIYLSVFCLIFTLTASAQHSDNRGFPIDTVGAPYCHPAYSGTNTNGDYIAGIAITGLLDEPKDPSTYPYQNIPFVVSSLYRSQGYEMILTAATNNQQTFAAWIDFDHSNTFEPGEKLGEGPNVSAGGTATFNFTIPDNTPTGTVRMRLMVVKNITGLTPCGSYTDGETIDVLIYINESPMPYCAPISIQGSSAGDYLAGINFGPVDYLATSPDTLGAAYVNLTTPKVLMAPGTSKKLYVKNNANYNEQVGFWVDWNNNTIFDSAEWVDTLLNLLPGQKDSITITVPGNQAFGDYRVRVRLVFEQQLSACASADYSIAYDMVITVGEVSVNETFADHFSLYPNPVSNTLFVTTKNGLSNNTLLAVYDVTGRMVASQKAFATAGGRVEIPVQGLAKGMYVLQIVENGKVAASRFVVE